MSWKSTAKKWENAAGEWETAAASWREVAGKYQRMFYEARAELRIAWDREDRERQATP